jgi:L-rhamnono-1,4-lactonase
MYDRKIASSRYWREECTSSYSLTFRGGVKILRLDDPSLQSPSPTVFITKHSSEEWSIGSIPLARYAMSLIPVLDSHIHLFALPQIDNLAWITKENKLYGQHRLDEYQKYAISDKFIASGIIFVETDVISGLEEAQWELPIEEYLYVERTVNKLQLRDEGVSDGSDFIKAIIPWAPVPLGPEGLLKYFRELKKVTVVEGNLNKIKGVRYLLQDKRKGTMLAPLFIAGLNWLGENNYTFDLGIDIHSNGIEQLEEFVLVDSMTENVTYIVNHLTKPDFELTGDSLEQVSQLWQKINNSNRNSYYIKLSGGFSELSEEIALSNDMDLIADKVIPWVKMFYDIFGPKRIIWGSDWPVSTLKFTHEMNGWSKWAEVSERVAVRLGLDLKDLFFNNSVEAYNL